MCAIKTNKQTHRTSVVVQWLRTGLRMQETLVQSLVWEDPTCRGATKPTCPTREPKCHKTRPNTAKSISQYLRKKKKTYIKNEYRTSRVVQWLRLWAFNAGGKGLIPGWGTKVPHAVWCGQKNLRKNEYRASLVAQW